jgi:hypothetical protein
MPPLGGDDFVDGGPGQLLWRGVRPVTARLIQSGVPSGEESQPPPVERPEAHVRGRARPARATGLLVGAEHQPAPIRRGGAKVRPLADRRSTCSVFLHRRASTIQTQTVSINNPASQADRRTKLYNHLNHNTNVGIVGFPVRNGHVRADGHMPLSGLSGNGRVTNPTNAESDIEEGVIE